MHISKPIANIFNTSISQGTWPEVWKQEVVTPVAKVFPPALMKNLRSISGLPALDKILERLISDLLIQDMKKHMDISQYGNQKGISIQHYLINMINKILTDTQTKSTEITAVIATLIDWKDAFPTQCPKLGIEAFIECGVRPSLIPLLMNYLQDRSMVVKWHNKTSKEKALPGGGPQGGLLGIMEYLAQSNKSANCVKPDSRFKFVDDLTALEKINILMVGLASFNSKYQVPNDILQNNLFIPGENLKSQEYLDKIQEWTVAQKMELNEEKTKSMIFNFTRKRQFSTRLVLKNKVVQTVKHTKLLGTIISDDLNTLPHENVDPNVIQHLTSLWLVF